MRVMKEFPIQGYWDRERRQWIPASTIPWDLIAPHEAQALNNHCGQTLERLAQRAGLSHCEAVAILEDRAWSLMNQREAVQRLSEIVASHLKK